MSAESKVPNIKDRKDIIILSSEIECPCGRTKERAHCPVCGRVKLYGLADTMPEVIPNNGDIVKDCKTYRCLGCGEKFNDVDWYFNCHAPKKIDIAAMKAKHKEQLRDYWIHRIQTGDTFDYNTRAKCRAETGFDPVDMQVLFSQAKIRKQAIITPTLTSTSARIKDAIENLEAWVKDHPEDLSSQKEIEQLKEELTKLEND